MVEGVKRYWVEEGPCECKQDGNDAMGGTFVYLESDVLQMRLDYAALKAKADKLATSLGWALQYGDWAENCDGNSLMKLMHEQANVALSEYREEKP